MENLNSFIEKLNERHNNLKSNINIDSLVNNMNFYESFIPDFFSKNGESEGIKSVYSAIKDNLVNEKSIISSDITKSGYIYKEYMEGMISFINDISNTTITESVNDLNSYKKKFEKAKEKDSLFIDSLYNGKLNEQSKMPLSEAVCNIEYLIDFIPELCTMKNQCVNLNESFNDVKESDKKSLIDNSLNMLYESVDNFCYSTIKNIITSYSNIYDKLFNESSNDKEEEIGFKLF